MSTQDLAGRMTSFSIELETVVCCSCGIPFGLPVNYKRKLLETHGDFYCPNGHTLVFNGESKSEKLQRLLRQKENELAQKIATNIQLDNQLTKIKKDISQGKCPCCGKTYKRLANHMARKHPKGR